MDADITETRATPGPASFGETGGVCVGGPEDEDQGADTGQTGGGDGSGGHGDDSGSGKRNGVPVTVGEHELRSAIRNTSLRASAIGNTWLAIGEKLLRPRRSDIYRSIELIDEDVEMLQEMRECLRTLAALIP